MSLRDLQVAVRASCTELQKKTTLAQQIAFLTTEIGEVQKEDLKRQGLYGLEAQKGAEERIAQELCDVIWNACRIADHLGVELAPAMEAMLLKNSKRTWGEGRAEFEAL